MQICLQISTDVTEVRLLEVRHKPGSDPVSFDSLLLAGPERLDAELFKDGEPLSPARILSDVLGQAQKFEETGRALFDAVVKGQVRQEWFKVRDKWKQDVDQFEQANLPGPKPVFRTYFCIQNERLAEIPWELLYEETNLFSMENCPCVRCALPAPLPRNDGQQLRIKVLVINAADETDAAIKAADEVAAIRTTLLKKETEFDLEIRNNPGSINELEQLITSYKPHVFHFIGHSRADEGKEPELLIYGGGRYLSWKKTQIQAFLQSIQTLRLTYLNACRTQLRTQSVAARARSLAEIFLERSLAVIAMNEDVRGRAAALCARTFYEGVANGLFVDQALSRARRAVANDVGGREPYLPALTVRTFPEHVLQIRPKPDDLRTEDFGSAVIDTLVPRFVDHKPERRELAECLFEGNARPRQAILVTGEDGVGKTWLIQWTLYMLALRGIRVHYLIPSAENWLEILRQLRDPGDNALSRGACTETEQWRFNWVLRHLASGTEAPPFPGGPQTDRAGSLVQILAANPVNRFDERACEEMRNSLLASAGGGMVIALDQWKLGAQGVEHPNFQPIAEHVLKPLARNKQSPIRLILAPKGQVKENDFPGWYILKVPLFGPPEIADLAEELLRRMYGDRVTPAAIAFVRERSNAAIPARKLYESIESLKPWLGS